jgi:Fe-S-cluster containining protein
MTPLAQLHADIDERVQTIRENRSDWLCGKGCDSCCRRLADVPQLTAAEWDLLREGLADLPPKRLQEIRGNMAALTGQRSAPITCPLLDLATGSCPVYAQRPVACRTYGFYVQRDLGYIATTSNPAWPMAPWPTSCGAITMPSITGSPALAKSMR